MNNFEVNPSVRADTFSGQKVKLFFAPKELLCRGLQKLMFVTSVAAWVGGMSRNRKMAPIGTRLRTIHEGSRRFRCPKTCQICPISVDGGYRDPFADHPRRLTTFRVHKYSQGRRRSARYVRYRLMRLSGPVCGPSTKAHDVLGVQKRTRYVRYR